MYMYLVLFLDEIGGNLRLSDYYSAAPLVHKFKQKMGVLNVFAKIMEFYIGAYIWTGH